jgi:Na+-transporting NADH:ubiquinone oxidoreductase subunit NqrC
MPFLLLVCGLLSGALVSALVISTTLAQGSFQISQLQQQDSVLARQRQALEAQVAQARSATVIEQRAYQLGMRPVDVVRFLDLRDGKVKTATGGASANGTKVRGSNR